MKKKFLVLATAIVLTLSATFAQDTRSVVPDAIVTELHQKFDNAANVQWQTTDNYYKASFTIDGQQLKAFYSFDGTMIGLSRNLTVDQLPLALIAEVKEKAATATVTDLFELLTDSRGTEYYITYKNDKEAKTYKSDGEYWVRY